MVLCYFLTPNANIPNVDVNYIQILADQRVELLSFSLNNTLNDMV